MARVESPATKAPTLATATVLYVAYLVFTSLIIFVIGFITTALGALVMVFALATFAAYAVVTSQRNDERDGLGPTTSGHAGPFRWRELRTTVLASLPALLLPAEVTSPMASVVFFLLFAVPTFCVAFGYHAWSMWRSRREPARSKFGSPLAPPGWYLDRGFRMFTSVSVAP